MPKVLATKITPILRESTPIIRIFGTDGKKGLQGDFLGGDLLLKGVPPGEDIGERILTAAVTGGEKIGVYQSPIRQFWCEKLDHNVYCLSLCRFIVF